MLKPRQRDHGRGGRRGHLVVTAIARFSSRKVNQQLAAVSQQNLICQHMPRRWPPSFTTMMTAGMVQILMTAGMVQILMPEVSQHNLITQHPKSKHLLPLMFLVLSPILSPKR